MTKTDQILDKVTQIRVKVGRIEEHLKAINGTIERHEEDINGIKKIAYKTAGGLAFLLVIIEIGFRIIS